MRRSHLLVSLLAAASLGAAPVDFAHEVVPILRKHCSECHTGDKKKGGFSMNTRASLLEGGENGAVVSLVQAQQSKLLEAVVSADPDIRMPPKGDRLSPADVATLRTWIEQGAVWTEGFAFKQPAYEPPLRPRQPVLPAAKAGRTHPLDRVLDGWLAEKGAPTPPPADDATFQRRVSLDLVGMLPSAEEAQAFAADRRPDKRVQLVRALLARDVDYADHWMVFWNDLLRNDYAGTGYIDGGRKQITNWLYLSLLANKPYDRFTRELVAPSSDSEGFAKGIIWRGAVSAAQMPELQYSQSVSQTFLGINMKCASCHDSFVDRWKLQETYDLAAVMAPDTLELFRCDKATGAFASPGWPFKELGAIDGTKPPAERLEQLARLMTDPGNGWLSRNLVNRIWAKLVGRGLVHPVDALRTRPWNEDLLDWLAADFVASGYDTKHLLRTICTSEAYAAATPAIEGQPQGSDYVFHGPLPRRMTAEQFTDALWQLTGAAPAKPDADVQRVSLDPAAPRQLPPRAQWIWNNQAAASPPGEKLTFRARINLLDPVTHAVAVATADNEVTMWVNGTKVGHTADWGKPFAEPIGGALQHGSNEILVVAANADAGGPAALKAEVRAILAGGGVTWVASDDSWEWTATLPAADGTWPGGNEPADWQRASIVENQGTWAPSDAAFADGVRGASGPQPMVRAVLVKCTPLMASLGRPNRDQVVTSRPTDLTTLEAIQLANEQALFETFSAGGRRWLTEHGNDPGLLAGTIFKTALGRLPTPAEATAVREILGDSPTESSVADCLWAVVMLPEFQLIR